MATTTKITHFTAHDKPGEPLPKKRPPTNFLSLWVSMDILNQLPSSTASPHWAVKCDSFPHSLAAGLLGPVAGTTSCTVPFLQNTHSPQALSVYITQNSFKLNVELASTSQLSEI